MQSFHVKKNDEVVVLSGADRGKRGRVIAVEGKKARVIVEGVRMTKKHMRKSQQHPQGTILKREGFIHISSVMRADVFDARTQRRSAGSNPA
jgi:large subunit ribosomal protein L24